MVGALRSIYLSARNYSAKLLRPSMTRHVTFVHQPKGWCERFTSPFRALSAYRDLYAHRVFNQLTAGENLSYSSIEFPIKRNHKKKTDSIQTWLTSMETLWSRTRPMSIESSWDRPEKPVTALKFFQALSIMSRQDATLVSWPSYLDETVSERSKIFNMKQDHKATKNFWTTQTLSHFSHQNCSLLCYLKFKSWTLEPFNTRFNISPNNSTENTFSKP